MLDRCDEAIADLDEALQLEPSDAFALKVRGVRPRGSWAAAMRPLPTWTKPCS